MIGRLVGYFWALGVSTWRLKKVVEYVQVDDSSHEALQTSDINGPVLSPFSDLYFFLISRGAALHD